MLLVNHLLIILIIASAIPNGILTLEEHPHSFNFQIGQFFARRCLKNKDLEYLEGLMRKMADFIGCLHKTMPKHEDEHDEYIEKHCFVARKEVMECMQQLVDMLKPCLHGEEEYIPKFIIDSFGEYLEYFCEHVRILTSEGLIDSNMSKCLNRFKKHQFTNPHNNCFNTIHFTDHMKGTPLTKEELCEDLDVIYSCYKHKFHKYCPESPKAWHFQGGLLNATRSPCESSKKILQ